MAGVLLPSVKLELVSKAWWNNMTGIQANFFSGLLRGLSSDREIVTKKIQGSDLAPQEEASHKAVRTLGDSVADATERKAPPPVFEQHRGGVSEVRVSCNLY